MRGVRGMRGYFVQFTINQRLKDKVKEMNKQCWINDEQMSR